MRGDDKPIPSAGRYARYARAYLQPPVQSVKALAFLCVQSI